MANSRQARKRAKQADKARARNMSHRSRFRTQLKRVEAAIQAGDVDGATASYQKAVPVIDAMAGRGLIHKNKAARHKSRLNAKIKALAAASG